VKFSIDKLKKYAFPHLEEDKLAFFSKIQHRFMRTALFASRCSADAVPPEMLMYVWAEISYQQNFRSATK
jgi:hypothetical protein